MDQFIQIKGKKLLDTFLDDYKSILGVDDRFLETTKQYIKTNERFDYLTELWYERLNAGDIDGAYQVYGDKHYLTDQFNCFRVYARQYLRKLTRPTREISKPLIEITNEASHVVDLGNGIGYSTAILSQFYPNIPTYGTNLPGTDQWDFGVEMGKRYGFEMVEDVVEIPGRGGLVFASEYFEHFQKPIEHLEHVINALEPRYLLIANAFNTWSIGHFEEYIVDDEIIPQNKISRMFNNKLRDLGYTKEKVGFFNSKPNFWKKRVYI